MGSVERTGGVPLFIEEVTRLLLERGEQGGAQAIPPTLQQSLTARLDRLGAARDVAMIGAVLGRGFSFPFCARSPGMEDTPLQQALERLAEADILLVEGLPPDAEYRFKHALIRFVSKTQLPLKRSSKASWPMLKRKTAISMPRRRHWMRHSRRRSEPANDGTTRSFIGRAAKFWLSGTLLIRRRRRGLSSPPSRSRESRAPAASSCDRR